MPAGQVRGTGWLDLVRQLRAGFVRRSGWLDELYALRPEHVRAGRRQHDLYGVAQTVEWTPRADEKVWMYDAKVVAR